MLLWAEVAEVAGSVAGRAAARQVGSWQGRGATGERVPLVMVAPAHSSTRSPVLICVPNRERALCKVDILQRQKEWALTFPYWEGGSGERPWIYEHVSEN